MKSLFSDTQIEHLITYVETRSGKSGLLRYAGQLYSKHVVTTNQGFTPAPTGFEGAHSKILEGNDKILNPPKDQLEEAPNLAQIDRGYWLSGDPLPVTEQNLLRGKEVFFQRCVGCHGIDGDGKGPGAQLHVSSALPTSRAPTTLVAAETPAPAISTTGSFAAGRAPGWRTSATGSPSTTSGAWCSSSKTIPNHTLRKNVVPEPKDYIVWQPSKELLAWLKSRQKLTGNASFSKEEVTDPFMQEARSVMPGLAPGDKFFLNDGKTPLSLKDAAAGIKAIYEDLLDRAWNEARARGDKLPRRRPEAHSPDRSRASSEVASSGASRSSEHSLSSYRRPRSLTRRPRAHSRGG